MGLPGADGRRVSQRQSVRSHQFAQPQGIDSPISTAQEAVGIPGPWITHSTRRSWNLPASRGGHLRSAQPWPFGASAVPIHVALGLCDCLDQLEPQHYYRFWIVVSASDWVMDRTTRRVCLVAVGFMFGPRVLFVLIPGWRDCERVKPSPPRVPPLFASR